MGLVRIAAHLGQHRPKQFLGLRMMNELRLQRRQQRRIPLHRHVILGRAGVQIAEGLDHQGARKFQNRLGARTGEYA